MDDLFLRIINREIPAEIFYEDSWCVAFYDKFPVLPGHFLVVPKIHSPNITEMDDVTLYHCMKAARDLGRKKVLQQGIKGFKIIVNTGATADQTIFHTHIHVVPFEKEVKDPRILTEVF